MGERVTTTIRPAVSEEIFPRSFEFPDPRLVVLTLLLLASVILHGQFASHGSASTERGRAAESRRAAVETVRIER
jgi:hypothetical protein